MLRSSIRILGGCVLMPLVLLALPEQDDSEVGEQTIQLFEAAERVFKNNCYNCHGATTQKGDLRLDREADAFVGGDSGSIAIIPHDSTGSLIVERMLLPRDDDDVMPPAKKKPVTPAEIEAVAAWIDAGAHWPDARTRAARSSTFVEVVDEELEGLKAAINATGAKAEYNSWDDRRIRIDLSYTDADKLDDAIEQLGAFGDRLIWLDVSGLALPNGFIESLADYPSLERLHLDRTNVSDEELLALKNLQNLNYLNLFGTEISDTSIAVLQSLSNLEKVFLANTAVTNMGATQLSESRSELVVVHR